MAKSNAVKKQEVLEMADKQPEQKIEETLSQEEVIHKIINRVEDNSAKVGKIVDELVYKHCHLLDELIAKYTEALGDVDNPLTEDELDQIAQILGAHLYTIGGQQEAFGIKEDMAKSVKMEIYNEIHARTPGTIADKQAASEAGTIEEEIVYRAYQRAYKRIKQKVEAGYEILTTIKKVISRRMVEMELSRTNSDNFRRGRDE